MTLNGTAAGRAVVTATGALAFTFVFWAVVWTARAYFSDMSTLGGVVLIAWFAQAIVGALFCMLGAFIAFKAEGRAGTCMLGAYFVAQGLATGYLLALGGVRLLDDPDVQLARLLVNLFAYGAALRAAQLFPQPLKGASLDALLRSKSIATPLWRLVRLLLQPWRVWTFAVAALILVPVVGSITVFQIGQACVIVVVVATIVANYRLSDTESRRKIYWLLAGAVVLLFARIATLIAFLFIDWLGVQELTGGTGGVRVSTKGVVNILLWTAANLGLMICVLLAVFYRGAISPALVVRRAAVTGAGLALLLFTFGVFTNYVSAIVADALQITQTLVEAVAGAVIAVAFKPLNDFLSRLGDRLLPKDVTRDRHGDARR